MLRKNIFCLLILAAFVLAGCNPSVNRLSIEGDQIYMDGKAFDMWGIRVASATEDQLATDHLVAQLDDYRKYGVNSVAVYFMGSRGGSYDPFSADGKSIDPLHRDRMEQIIRECNDRGMAIITGIFYQRLDSQKIHIKDWEAAKNAVRTVASWLSSLRYKNVILNIANEQNSTAYNVVPWKNVREPGGIRELCDIAKETAPGLIVGAGGYDIEKNKLIGTSGAVDILLFDTSRPEENSEFHYNIYKAAGVRVPVVNVEMFGGWTKKFVDGVFSNDPDISYYYKEADAAARINGLYTFFFASDWSQSKSSGKANRYDLAGKGTPEDPGIRWFFEYVARLKGISVRF